VIGAFSQLVKKFIHYLIDFSREPIPLSIVFWTLIMSCFFTLARGDEKEEIRGQN